MAQKWFKAVDGGAGIASLLTLGNWFLNVEMTTPAAEIGGAADDVFLMDADAAEITGFSGLTWHGLDTTGISAIATMDTTGLIIDGGALVWGFGQAWLGDATDAASALFSGAGSDNQGTAPDGAIFEGGAINISSFAGDMYLRNDAQNVGSVTGDIYCDANGAYPTGPNTEGTVNGNVIVEADGFTPILFTGNISGKTTYRGTQAPNDVIGGGVIDTYVSLVCNTLEGTIYPMLKGLAVSGIAANNPLAVSLQELNIPDPADVVDGELVTTATENAAVGTYPTTATSKAEQLADDQAEVNSNKDKVEFGEVVLTGAEPGTQPRTRRRIG